VHITMTLAEPKRCFILQINFILRVHHNEIIMLFASQSVSLFVLYSSQLRYKRTLKIKIKVNVSLGKSNRCANFCF